jgi:transposase
MISLAPGTKVYLASKPVSMRLGFDGLAALVRPCSRSSPMVAMSSCFAARAAIT